jgi:hypothetical protein
MTDLEFDRLLRQKVGENDLYFQFWVGRCYYNGEGGIEKNPAEAIKWYTLAAQQGHAIAQNILGARYHLGEGVEQDYQKARDYYMFSREQGNWAASKNLGSLYRKALGVPKDLVKAKAYYEEALVQKDYELAPASAEAIERIQAALAEVNAVLEAEKVVTETEKAKRTGVFISYAHEDSEFVDEMRPHLKILEKRGIVCWNDTKLKSGEKWDARIKEEMSKAKVIVFLVSASFLASDYISRDELPPALTAAESEGAELLWIPARTCDLDDEKSITQYQAIGDPKTPLESCGLPERNTIYTKLSKRIKEILGT